MEQRRSLRAGAAERPYHCTFADGSEISRGDVEHVRRALWGHAVLFDWRQGDILLLDNSRVAHGRMPFQGQRRILAILSEPQITKRSAESDAGSRWADGLRTSQRRPRSRIEPLRAVLDFISRRERGKSRSLTIYRSTELWPIVRLLASAAAARRASPDKLYG